MKKTIVKILTCVVAAACVVACMTGCQSKGKKPAQTTASDVVLADFETWAPDFQLCRISETFGKVSMNSDAKYIKTGVRSARIDPVGNGWMYFPTYSETFDFDYTDFTYVDRVRIELYNAQETERNVYIGFVTDVQSLSVFNRAAEETFALQPGWNTLDLYVNTDIICLVSELTDIQGIYFKFDVCTEGDITDETPRYYLDSIKLIRRETPHTAVSNVQFGQNEIIDFERFYHKYFVINDFGAELDIVKAADYGISATSGSKVLRLAVDGTADGAWRYYIKIPALFLQAGALGKLTDEQFNSGYFCWDSYNKGTTEYNTVALFEIGTGGSNYAVASYPKRGSWTTHKIKLSDIQTSLPGWKDNIGQFAFSIKDDSAVHKELFFDNFRVEFENQ